MVPSSVVQGVCEMCVYTDLDDDTDEDIHVAYGTYSRLTVNRLVNKYFLFKVVSTVSSSHSRLFPKSLMSLYEVIKALLNQKDLVLAV